jgi:hypothetical protein
MSVPDADDLFVASADLFRASLVLFIRTGSMVLVDGRLNPLIASIAESTATMVALADELDIAPPTEEETTDATR